MYSSILIATDLSRDSDELVRCVAGLHALGCRQAHLVYGIEMDDIGGLRSNIEQLVGVEIDRQKAALDQAGIETTGHVAMRPAQQEIERIAAENRCDLVVAGSRVHSLAGDIVAGGIAATVLTSARQPLLMLRLHHTDSNAAPRCSCWPCAPLKHLLCPTDFSDNADHVLDCVERLAQETSPERITLMHVQDRKRIDPHLAHRLEAFNATDRDRLDLLRQRLAAVTSADIDTELRYGDPAHEIVEFSSREKVTLVVMGTHGRGYVNELFLGSVSHNVARHAPVPVLLIPAARETPKHR